MTPEEFEEKLMVLAADVSASGQTIVSQMASDGKALVNLRIVRDGLPDKTYSKKPFPTYFHKNKVLNQGGTKYIEENPMGTWGDFRKAQGLKSDKVNLSYTSRMWSAIGVTKRRMEGGTFVAELGATDRETEAVLQHNQERYGNFLVPNEQEKKLVDKVAEDAIIRIINKHL